MPTSSFCVWPSSCSSSSWWKNCFPTEWSWQPCWKSVDYTCMGLFLNVKPYSIDRQICPCARLQRVDYCCFVVNLEITTHPAYFILFQDYFDFSGSFVEVDTDSKIHTKLRRSKLVFLQNLHAIFGFIWIMLSSEQC